MKKDYETLDRLTDAANVAKERLIEIELKLEEAGFIRKANSLSTIIEKLEIWQNAR